MPRVRATAGGPASSRAPSTGSQARSSGEDLVGKTVRDLAAPSRHSQSSWTLRRDRPPARCTCGSGEDAGLPADEYLACADFGGHRTGEQSDGEQFAAADVDDAAGDDAVERHYRIGE